MAGDPSEIETFPADWQRLRVGEFAMVKGGKRLPAGTALVPYQTRHPYLRIVDFKNGHIDKSALMYVPDDVFPRIARYIISTKDIYISIVGTIGLVGIVDQELDGANLTENAAKVCNIAHYVDKDYLSFFLRSQWGQHQIGALTVGSTQPKLALFRIEDILVPLPPLPEQRAIAHILGTLDDKIELNRRMNETLEGMARALFQSWFVDFDPVRAKAAGRDPGLPKDLADLFPDSFEDSELGEIPKGWRVGVLDDLAALILGGDWGKDAPNDEATSAARCIRGADIPDLQVGGTGKMPIRYLKPSSLEKRRLSDGDLVVEISGGSPTQSTGRPVLVSNRLLQRLDAPLVCSNFCRLLKMKSTSYSKFTYLWLRSLYTKDEFLQFENGTTGIKNLAFTLFSANYKLCVPPVSVLTLFDQRVAALFEKQQVCAGEADTLAALRDALLPKLLSGDLRVG